MTKKFVKQKTGAGGYFLLCPNSRHWDSKINLNKKSHNWRIIALSGLLRCTIFLFHNWSSFTKIISSFSSLQDIKTALFNVFNWIGMLSLYINGPKTVKLHLEQQQNALSDFVFSYSFNDWCPPIHLQCYAHLFTYNVYRATL